MTIRYIVIDCETTGIFKHDEIRPDGTKRVMRSDEVGQPRMAEFAAAVVDESFTIIDTFQQYVIPDGWQDWDGSLLTEMPPGAFEANKLTFDFLRAKGRPVREALEYYSDRLAEGLVPLGYNMQFDGRQLRGELRRAGMDDRFNETPNVCAMRSIRAAGIKIPKLNGKGGMPRLIDCAAHFNVPGYTEEKHHKAADDVFATVLIARALNQMGKLIPPSIYRAKGLEGGAS